MLAYIILRVAAFLARYLPERWARAIARGTGTLVYYVSPLAEAGRDNFRHVLGPQASPAQVDGLTRHAFRYRLLNYYELLRLPTLPFEELNRRSVIEGLEHLDRLVKEKRGAVVASGHMGPMEFMMHSVVGLGYPLIGIAEHLEPERLNAYVIGLRSAHGLNLISTKGSLLDVFRRLRRGEVLISVMDRDSTDTGLVVDFLGAPAWMPDGYARVAVQANVPVIFGFCRKTDQGVHSRLYPPIYPDRSLGKEQAVLTLVEQVIRMFEDVLRRYPEEWHLSAPVWQLAQDRLNEEASDQDRTGLPL